MKEKVTPNNIAEEKEIPEFKKLRDVLNCDSCDADCKYSKKNGTLYNYSPDDSRWSCKKFSRLIRIIELIAGSVLIILSIIILYAILKNFFMTTFIAIALIGLMIWFDLEHSSKLFKTFFENQEKKRKDEYNENVTKIKAENEAIRKKANGETEEYERFKKNAISLTDQIVRIKDQMFSKIDSSVKSVVDEEENNRLFGVFSFGNSKVEANTNANEETQNGDELLKTFETLSNNLIELTDKVSPSNFEYAYIQKFYNNHLLLLKGNIEVYSLKNPEELTFREKSAFEKLLEAFILKMDHVNHALKEQTENDFVAKMEELQGRVLNNKGDE